MNLSQEIKPKEDSPIVEEESGVLNDIVGGAANGLSKVVTSSAELALDGVNYLDNKFFEDSISDLTIAEWRDKMNFEDELSSIAGADKDSMTFQMTSGLVEGTGIALQVLAGVGAVATAGTAGGIAGGIAGIAGLGAAGAKSIKAGAKVVSSGSKLAKLGKAAAVGAAEEVRATGSGDGEGILTNLSEMMGLYERDEQLIKDTQEEYLRGVLKKDPQLYEDMVSYLAVNPKAELDPQARITNRAKAGAEGAIAGPALEKGIGGVMHLLKKFKTFNVNFNRLKDTTEEVKEMTKITVEGKDPNLFKDKVKKDIKAKRVLPQDAVNEKYFDDYEGKYKATEEELAQATSTDFDKVNARLIAGERLSSKEAKLAKEEIRKVFNIDKMTPEKRRMLASLEGDTPLEELLTNKDFVDEFQKSVSAGDARLTQINEEILADLGSIYKKIGDNKATADDMASLYRMKQLQRSIEMRKGATASLAAQQLRMAGIDKASGTAEINRLSNLYRIRNGVKKGTENGEYYEFMSKVHSDPEFRKQFAKEGSLKDKTKATLLTWDDKLNSYWKKNLLLATKGIVRNVVEGVGISALKVLEQETADALSILGKSPRRKVGTTSKAYAKALSNTVLHKKAFESMVQAMKGGNTDLAAKVGATFIEDKGLLETVMSVGQRGIVAFDAPLKIMNEAAFIDKSIMNEMDVVFRDEDLLESALRKNHSGKPLDDTEAALLERIASDVDPKEFLQKFNDMPMAEFDQWYKTQLLEGGKFDAAAGKYSDSIAMNKDYEDMGLVANSLAKVIDPMSKLPIVRSLAPFPKPALSALDTALEWSPFINSFDTLKKISSKAVSPEEKQKAIARFGISTSAGFTLWSMLDSGLVVGGGPQELRDSRSAKDVGFSPYTIRIGDADFSMQGSIFGNFLEVVDRARTTYIRANDVSQEAATQANNLATGLFGALADLPHGFYADTFKNFTKAMAFVEDPNNKANQAAASQIFSSLGFKRIPLVGSTAAKDLRYIADDFNRDTATKKTGLFGLIDRHINETINSIPVLSEMLPPRVSYLTGEELEHGKNGALPMTYLGDKDHEFVDYFRKLLPIGARNEEVVGGDNDMSFMSPNRTLKASGLGSYKLDAEEFSEVLKFTADPSGRGVTLYDTLQKFMNSPSNEIKPEWTNAQKQMRIDQMKEIIGNYKKAGREKFKATSEKYKAWVQETAMGKADFARKRAEGLKI